MKFNQNNFKKKCWNIKILFKLFVVKLEKKEIQFLNVMIANMFKAVNIGVLIVLTKIFIKITFLDIIKQVIYKYLIFKWEMATVTVEMKVLLKKLDFVKNIRDFYNKLLFAKILIKL